ncbi:type I-E CRISPR-associated protein Cas5/CasD [Streptomyces sp. NEAU-W12]|uniref:type I-E CRISPR-associated protein Cas5/CasD n=1 Tax=Streptomyces sp. NEAU-W12 TaxID=2994668 RepID=UPI00224A95EE|nr:type I-E CRISPR-associated protein Cas5/CasD [Streptomyces sp. NEAU-W12]MCX2928382.1 type I-E CRISPR-associated protein Cas5/CasD [Streptomyces sp. NEAU-W12]
MSGLLLRLAGPLQSWGERSAFTPVRDTAPFPTRSALIGMFAAAEGIGRDEAGLERYQELRLTVRVDRPGVRLVDYHTAGGGFPKDRTAATSGGSNKGAAVVTRRHYLSDAVFVVAVTANDETIERLADALSHPHWAPYLGRRSCVPDEPFLLRRHVDDPEEELRTRVPLSRTAPQAKDSDGQKADTIPVEFLLEQPPPTSSPGEAAPVDIIDVNDVPVSFAQHGRSHTGRRLHRTQVPVPRFLAGPPQTLIQRLIDYAHLEESA